MDKKNILIAVTAGVLIGIFTIPTINNLPLPGILVSFGAINLALLFGILSIFGYFFAELLGKWMTIFRQIGRFAIVGVLNTVLDFAVLNLLITMSGVTGGPMASVFKGVSFIVAVTNSYYWNKYWTFEFQTKVNKELLQFFIISAIGFGFNIGAFSFTVDVIGPIGNITPQTWANIGALSGTLAGLAWNFIGYKFIVFKKKA